MKTVQNATLVVLLLTSASGCGQQLVEFIDLGVSDDLSAQSDLAAGAGDLAGRDLALANGGSSDGAAPPEVISTNPPLGSTNACVPFQIDAVFDEPMDPNTIIAANFTLSGPALSPVNGMVGYDAATRTASFLPSSALMGGTTYLATITTGAKNIFGAGLVADKVWSFTNGATPCMQPVDLRSLGTFVAIAGAGLTNSNSMGVTVLNGDVGLTPLATCLGDGVPCSAIDPTINGTLYANDPAGKASAAKADLVSAYNDAQGRPPGTIEADLSGLILPSGVYTSGTSMMIATGGIVTLDANNDQNAVWIFQIGSTLTVGTGAEVKLINGAKAANVFWAVGSSSTLNANVKFKGTILAQSSNSVEVGCTVDGRLLCSNGAITLKSDTINLP